MIYNINKSGEITVNIGTYVPEDVSALQMIPERSTPYRQPIPKEEFAN